MPTPKKRAPEKEPVKNGTNKEPVRVVRPPKRSPLGDPKTTAHARDVLAVVGKRHQGDPDRRAAGLVFIHDTEQRTVAWLHETHYAGTEISTEMLHKWAVKDKWKEKRAEFWAQVDTAITRNFAQRVIKAQLEELDSLETLGKKIRTQLRGEENEVVILVNGNPVTLPVIPNNFEKRGEAGRLLLAIDQRIDEKRQSIMGHIPVASSGAPAPPPVRIELTTEEARAMALARLRVQQGQAAQDAAIAASEDADGEP